MSAQATAIATLPGALLALYDEALPVVYGYFVRRCSDRGTAEDLTSETFLAACETVRAAPTSDPPADGDSMADRRGPPQAG
nr:sigma factor [Mycobacterium riyadhense]